ncbi:MAG: ribosome biogenesis GTPase Der [Verrucomicrobiota bacterium]|nr:ribosome biogenesis GTPase Der [Verrucomicrobiota bacterium]
MKRRVVAIVGRPNVGKSAIFNRLAGRRIAIVHEESGVTRDRLIREVTWEDQRFDLIDTGGICNLHAGRRAGVDPTKTADEIEAGIRTQAAVALEDAAAAILAVDIEAGLHPLDREVARMLHEAQRPAVVAANKADTEARDLQSADFEELGYPVFPVSALHNRGFDPLMENILPHLPEAGNPAAQEALKVAIVGRPNVGKSSYVNRLLNSDRVIVSAAPGTTRDSIDIPFAVGKGAAARRYLLIDTAGLRPVGKVHSAVERFSMFRAEKSIGRADVVALVLDATTGPTRQDKHVAALVQEHRKPCLLVMTKWDLAGELTQTKRTPAVFGILPFLTHCPLVYVSAKTGYNIRRSVDAIDLVAAQSRVALPTGVLNRAILDACERVQAPSHRGRALRVFYSTQVGSAPMRIRVFVNHPEIVRASFEAYLIRSLREKFGIEGAPVLIQFRGRREQE